MKQLLERPAPRRLKSWLLTLLLTATCAGAQPDAIVLDQWKVHAGDDPRWAAPEFDDSTWETVPAPVRHTSAQPFFAGFRWYRTSVIVPAEWQGRKLGIGLGPLDEVFDVFANGVLIGRSGAWTPEPRGRFPAHLAFSFNAPPALLSGRLSIAIRRWTGATRTNYNQFSADGMSTSLHAPEVGPAAFVAEREAHHASASVLRGILNPLIFILVMVAAIVSLMLFYSAGRRPENFWLAVLLSSLGGAPLLAAIGFFLQADLRSPTSIVALLWGRLASTFTLLFLASLCPRLRWPLLAGASLQTILSVGSAIEFATQWPLFGTYLTLVELITVVATVAAAADLLSARNRSVHSALLAASLFLQPIGTYWNASISFRLGLERYRFPEVAGLSIDPRSVALLLFALLASWGLHLRLRQAQQRQSMLDRDLEAARLVQKSLLQAGGSATFAVEAVYEPANEVGGDFYQSIGASDGSLLLVTGDVSGKGLPASLLVAAVVGALGDLTSRRPADVLSHLNRALAGKTRGGFVTCCCALFSADGGVQLANAGHVAPYCDGAETTVEAGLPLGIVPDAEYAETRVRGSHFTFVSDGVVEAANGEGELFGFDRTRAMSPQPAREIADAAKAWGQNDDITVVTVRKAIA